MQCEEESGDVLLCLPCKLELEREESRVHVPFNKEDLGVTERKTEGLDFADVTILRDGSVVAPEAPVEPRPPGPTVPTTEVEQPPADERVVKIPVRKPVADESRVKRRKRRAEAARAGSHPEPQVTYDEMITARRAAPRAAQVEEEKEFVPGGPFKQTLSGFPYGLGAALGVSAVWLLVVLVARQWGHIVIFTLGIVVPWAWYKGTTARKRMGEKVWDEPPAPLWVALPSLVLVAALVVPLQLAAYKLLYRSNPQRLPFSDFYDRFFTAIGWPLLIAGLVAAFAVPFLLKAGADWKKPRVLGGEEDDAGPGDEEA
jgi:hypothetical protein